MRTLIKQPFQLKLRVFEKELHANVDDTSFVIGYNDQTAFPIEIESL